MSEPGSVTTHPRWAAHPPSQRFTCAARPRRLDAMKACNIAGFGAFRPASRWSAACSPPGRPSLSFRTTARRCSMRPGRLTSLATVIALLSTACVTTSTTSTTWGEGSEPQWERVGYVASIRETVQRQQGNPGAGAVAGAVIGGLLGSSVGASHPLRPLGPRAQPRQRGGRGRGRDWRRRRRRSREPGQRRASHVRDLRPVRRRRYGDVRVRPAARLQRRRRGPPDAARARADVLTLARSGW